MPCEPPVIGGSGEIEGSKGWMKTFGFGPGILMFMEVGELAMIRIDPDENECHCQPIGSMIRKWRESRWLVRLGYRWRGAP